MTLSERIDATERMLNMEIKALRQFLAEKVQKETPFQEFMRMHRPGIEEDSLTWRDQKHIWNAAIHVGIESFEKSGMYANQIWQDELRNLLEP